MADLAKLLLADFAVVKRTTMGPHQVRPGPQNRPISGSRLTPNRADLSAGGDAQIAGYDGELPGVEVVEFRVLGTDQEQRVVELEDLRSLDISRLAPVRFPTPHHGQTNIASLYYSIKQCCHLYAESRLEARWLLWWDFCVEVSAVATQPLVIVYVDVHGVLHEHTPDALVTLSDGSVHLVNIKPAARATDERVASDLAACAWLSQRCGWSVALLHDIDRVVVRNLRWIRNFARPPWDPSEVWRLILDLVGSGGARIDSLLGVIDSPFARPVLFNLIWNGDLVVDLTQVLDGCSTVWSAEVGS